MKAYMRSGKKYIPESSRASFIVFKNNYSNEKNEFISNRCSGTFVFGLQ